MKCRKVWGAGEREGIIEEKNGVTNKEVRNTKEKNAGISEEVYGGKGSRIR